MFVLDLALAPWRESSYAHFSCKGRDTADDEGPSGPSHDTDYKLHQHGMNLSPLAVARRQGLGIVLW